MLEAIIFFFFLAVTLLPTMSEISFSLCSVIISTLGPLIAALRFDEWIAEHSFYETLFRFLALDEIHVALLG